MVKKFKDYESTIKISTRKFDAVLFDMDGVVTKTAVLHAAAWKEAFDSFLESRAQNFEPFDIISDYLKYVDGKPRYAGVASFLKSRGIELPEGERDDKAGFESIYAVGNMKNDLFIRKIEKGKIEVYETTLFYIQALKSRKIKTAVITSSENGRAILNAANLQHIFDVVVDGTDAKELKLKGKPDADTFLEAARQLNVLPERAVVVEDAEAGVEAGRRGEFGLVIGVNRADHVDELKAHGADIVVNDLSELAVEGDAAELPSLAISDLGISEKNWVLSFEGFEPEHEGRREALCSLGNGYLCTRAAAPESKANLIHGPGTYMAGVYDRLTTKRDGVSIENEDLVNLPNWLCLSFSIDGEDWFNLSQVNLLDYRQELNLREGILYRQIHFRDKKGRETSILERRFVHMRHFHLCGLESTLVAHNWSGRLTVHAALDGTVQNLGSRMYSLMERKHLSALQNSADRDSLFLMVQTKQSEIHIAEAARIKLKLNDEEFEAAHREIIEPDYVAQELEIDLLAGDSVKVQKLVAVFSSRDFAISEPGLAAREALKKAPDFEKLLGEQIETWRQLWRRFDLSMETDDLNSKMQISLLLHLHSFHVLQTTFSNSIDLDVGVPARGWSEGYQGHVFWDDLFFFPFLNLRMPEVTQSLLKYRYRRLDAARQIALDMGAKGARFPWQSGSDGREETPDVLWYPKANRWVKDYSHLQIHVNAAIAFDVWQYYQVTGNLEFMYAYGAEMIFEIARFFASVARYNAERQRYEIHGVVGPDEYHVAYPDSTQAGINNNAYTNIMAVWTLCRALDLLKILPDDRSAEIRQRLKLEKSELRTWWRISRRMFVPITKDGIIVQFEGYENLEEFPWRKDSALDLPRLAEELKIRGGVLNEFKISKQADVLMLFYLFSTEELQELFEHLGYDFEPDFISKNIEHYVPYTANNSTLSRVALTWILSRMDRAHSLKLLSSASQKELPRSETFPKTWDVFREALGSDYMDIQGGTTPEGIHLGAMAGTVDIVQRCYTGIVTRDDVLWVNPQLPQGMTRLSFHIQYRHQSVLFEITRKGCKVTAGHSSAEAIKIGFKEVCELQSGESVCFDLETGKTCNPLHSESAA